MTRPSVVEIWKMRSTIREIQETTLVANGWTQVQWHHYWAWEKKAGPDHFLCLTVGEALLIESALQGFIQEDFSR